MNNHSNSSYFVYAPRSRESSTIITRLAVGIVVGFLIIVVNLATILTFSINRHLRRRSVYCLINLAVADMLYGLFIVVYNLVVVVAYLGRAFILSSVLVFIKSTVSLLLSVSLLSLAVVSLERVYATFFPFQHRTTRRRMYVAVFTITWLISFAIMMFIILFVKSSVFNRSIDIFILVLFLVCLVIICTSYTAIFVKVKIQTKRIQPNQQQAAAIRMRQKREQHLAMTLFIVTVLSLITWLPFILSSFLLILNNQDIPQTFKRLFILLQHTNSLINPIVYVFRMRDFRKALKQLTFKCLRDQQQNHLIGHHGNHDRQQQPPIELQNMQ